MPIFEVQLKFYSDLGRLFRVIQSRFNGMYAPCIAVQVETTTSGSTALVYNCLVEVSTCIARVTWYRYDYDRVCFVT